MIEMHSDQIQIIAGFALFQTLFFYFTPTNLIEWSQIIFITIFISQLHLIPISPLQILPPAPLTAAPSYYSPAKCVDGKLAQLRNPIN